jgi:sporulation protein YlmC with PRC-barrel domain
MASRALPIEDVGSLPGKKITDQQGQEVGKVCEIYEQDGEPMWVTVKSSTGMASDRVVFIPLARLKQEDEEIRVPYPVQHIQDSPEVSPEGELSEEQDRELRNYYSVDLGDEELRENNNSYAAQVPDSDAAVKKAED